MSEAHRAQPQGIEGRGQIPQDEAKNMTESILVVLGFLGVAALIGLKPNSYRNVIECCFIAGGTVTVLLVSASEIVWNESLPLIYAGMVFSGVSGALMIFALGIRVIVGRFANPVCEER